jgi:hypothetical protein
LVFQGLDFCFFSGSFLFFIANVVFGISLFKDDVFLTVKRITRRGGGVKLILIILGLKLDDVGYLVLVVELLQMNVWY